MNPYPPSLKKLILELSKLPGIGEKTATRLALHILRSPLEDVKKLAESLIEVKKTVRFCSTCFNLADTDPCEICGDPGRDATVLCVVESPADLMAIESSGAYKGRYHVLQGVLSPLDGIGPDDLKIKELLQRVTSENIEEVVLALNPSAEGETTAAYLTQLLRPKGVKLTQIAYGIPMGGDLKYADKVTLTRALRGRLEPFPETNEK
ncbi:MAG: recombination protein RecR [Deltaproteobacteria bacterium]|nr:MAG: recombination protein RecR [Deltaproteobacteria bacterium]